MTGLVIGDDHSVFLDAMSAVLIQRGYEVTVARSVRDTIETVRRTQPDVCLIDRHFAGDNGITAIVPMLSASSRMTVWDDVDPSEKLRIYDKGVVRNPTHETLSQQMVSYRLGDVRIPILDGREPLAKLVDDVHAGICDGAETRVGERVGYDVVRCIEAACASVESGGGWVNLPPPP